MKKTYLQPETASLKIRDHQPLMSNTVTLPVGDGGNSGTPNEDDDVSEFDDLLAKPTILYDVWDDDKENLDFHTDN